MTEENVNVEQLRSTRPEEIDDDEINLGELFHILKQRWLTILLTFSAIVTTTGILTFLQTPIFDSKGQILISKTNNASILTGLSEELSLDPLSNKSNPIDTEIQVLRSIPILKKVIESLDLRDKGNKPLSIKVFRANISANAVSGTDVLEVGYQDPNPQTAADVVNTLMQFYLSNDIEVNRSQTKAARLFISQQIPRAEEQLAQTEAKIRQFKEKNRVVELASEAQVAVQGLASLKASIVETESKLLAAQERSRQLQAKFGGVNADQAVSLGKISESKTIQNTLVETKKLEDQLAIARTTFQPNHPTITDLEEQLKAINSSLEVRIQQTVGSGQSLTSGNLELGQTTGLELITALVMADVEANSMAESLASLQQEYQSFLTRSDVLPTLEQKQSELSRDLESARQNYVTLLTSLQKAQLAENQNLGNARIINMAQVSDKPIAPRKAMNLLMGGFLGVIGGAGLALLLHRRDIRLRSISAIRAIFPYTLLGTIPLFPNAKESLGDRLNTGAQHLFVRDDPKSAVSEMYRMINTNLRFSRSEGLKVMVITSSLPGEGKSTTLANLALAISELGARVLLIDADMRRPTQHQLWEIPNRLGLSHVLVEWTQDQKLPFIEVEPNLHVLASGSCPPNPLALIDSSKMKTLMLNLRSEYDYILIDAPPITVASDVVLLGAIADGMILVGRPEVANRPAAQATLDTLIQSQLDILGLVVNGVNVKNESYGYYYSNNYYKSGYYGDNIQVSESDVTLSQKP